MDLTDRYLNSKEVAARLGISLEALKKWRHERKISFITLGHRTVRYTQQEVDRIAQAKTTPATAVVSIADAAFWRGKAFRPEPKDKAGVL